METFRPRWLWLHEIEPILVARGFTADEAKVQIARAVQAGRIALTDHGNGPLLRFPSRPQINLSGTRAALASGQADILTSTVIVPCQIKEERQRLDPDIVRCLSTLGTEFNIWFMNQTDMARTKTSIEQVAVQMLSDDVDRLWPDPTPLPQPNERTAPPANDDNPELDYRPETHSGLSGRPTAKHLYMAQLEKRWKAGEMLNSVGEEAAALLNWLQKKHPEINPAAVRTVENNIRDRHREMVRSQSCTK